MLRDLHCLPCDDIEKPPCYSLSEEDESLDDSSLVINCSQEVVDTARELEVYIERLVRR